MTKQWTTWYVFPHNKRVNKIVALAVDNEEFRFAGELNCKSLTGGSVKAKLWDVPYTVITALKDNNDVGGKFTVFVRKGNGQIRQFDPAKSRQISKEKELANQGPH
jgi:hypothetical protein